MYDAGQEGVVKGSLDVVVVEEPYFPYVLSRKW